jgi:SOUL heme-binding protein
MQRLAIVVATALISLMGGYAMAIEQPEYRVLEHDGAFELREYQPYMLAETEVDAGFMSAGNVAFGRLLRYISDKNIAMTAPVEQASTGGTYRVAFVVPRKFDRNTVPQPNDPRVSIREVPSRVVGAWRTRDAGPKKTFVPPSGICVRHSLAANSNRCRATRRSSRATMRHSFLGSCVVTKCCCRCVARRLVIDRAHASFATFDISTTRDFARDDSPRDDVV